MSRSLPQSKQEFLWKVRKGIQHYKNYEKYHELSSPLSKYYEFGAGRDLSIPITMTFYELDVTCIDIRKLVIPSLINDSLAKFIQHKKDLPFEPQSKHKELKGDLITAIEQAYNLSYQAPKDARKTGFSADSFDFISSTFTLEHIPKNDILLILKECHRLLCKGGVLSLMIDYKDHWSYIDHNISAYNFLQYSTAEWRKYNPTLHYQNRLRHSDYLALIAQTDFKMVKELTELPTEKDKDCLKQLKLAQEFRHYHFDDLAIKSSEIVMVK